MDRLERPNGEVINFDRLFMTSILFLLLYLFKAEHPAMGFIDFTFQLIVN